MGAQTVPEPAPSGRVATAVLAIAAGLMISAGPARAQEVRIGGGYAPHGPEKGASIVVDYLFNSPSVLKFAGSPRPYLGAQFSLDGFTNYAQTGLIWRFEQKRTYFEIGGGLAVHDGHLNLPAPMVGLPLEENAKRRYDRKKYIAFDNRWVFHATAAFGLRLNERWALEIEGQHWSNGELGNDTHDGADSLGLRAAYRF